MKTEHITPPDKLVSYVKNIMIFESRENNSKTIMPVYADGYPGVVFQTSIEQIYYNPGNRKLSQFFLYGQKIKPIELCLYGRFKMIVFQLYPFAIKELFGIDPKGLNDNCYDLKFFREYPTGKLIDLLISMDQTPKQIDIISSFLTKLIKFNKNKIDERVLLAVNLIQQSKGTIAIKELRKNIHITERTLERQFSAQIGVTPKKFARIIQFNASYNQLVKKGYEQLTDIVFDTGFADQSHFIRMFKAFTGITPSDFKKSRLN